jgi:putative iron-regulated protein
LKSISDVFKGINKNGVGNGKGISNILLIENPSINDKISLQFKQAIESMELIPVSYSYAAINDKKSIDNAVQKVSNLLQSYQYEVAPIIKDLK